MSYENLEVKDKKILSFLVEDQFRLWRHAGFLLGFSFLFIMHLFFVSIQKNIKFMFCPLFTFSL